MSSSIVTTALSRGPAALLRARRSGSPGHARGDERRTGDGRLTQPTEHGFTLVELMVTITVMAVLASAMLWALPAPGGRVADEALRFAARVRAARDQAVVDARPVSLWVTPGGYGFDRRVAGRWLPADGPLKVERWAEGTRANPGDTGGRTRVVFDPTGVPDRAADVRLERSGRAMLVRLGADGSVRADAQ